MHDYITYVPLCPHIFGSEAFNLNRRILIISIICAAALSLCALAASYLAAHSPRGHLKLCVSDAFSLAPVSSAVIVFPKSSQVFETDASGRVTAYSVPCDTDCGFLGAAQPDYGECEFIVYAKGYLPCVWMNVHVYPSKVREGPAVFLFPENSESVSVTVFSEAPTDEVMERFVKKYDPSR